MSKDKIKSLYDTFVADGYEMESEDEFRTNLGDPNKRKAAYDALVADGYEMESYEDFENNIGFGLESYARSLGVGEETIKKAKEWLGGTTAQPSAQPTQPTPKKQTFDDVLAEAKDYDMTATKDAPKDGVMTSYVPGEIIGQQEQTPLYESRNVIGEQLQKDSAPKYSGKSFDEIWREAGGIEAEKANATTTPQVPQEYADTFGEGIAEGSKALGYGMENLAAEGLRLVTGSQSDYDMAIDMLSHLRKMGVNPNEVDADEIIDLYNQSAEHYIEEREANKEGRTKYPDGVDRRSMLDQIDESVNLFSPTKAKKIKASRRLAQALKDANGDMDKAKDLLIIRSVDKNEETVADRWSNEAREGLRNVKETKGFGAWVGNLLPQMAGNALALTAAVVTKKPQIARAIGLGNTAMLTASTAGSSMATARDYADTHKGVSEGDIWRAGIVDGGIEYLTEKIPLDMYLGNVLNKATKQTGLRIAGDIGKEATDAELDKLLKSARSQFGGRLLTANGIKQYLAQVGTEGASEFMAGVLQTLSPMIYQNPEDYPTLLQSLEDGWEGAKAGFFMGAFLGGGSTVIANRQQRARRKAQGHVYLADAGDQGIVEIVGYNEDGTYQILDTKGKESSISKDALNDITTIAFDSFDKGRVVNDGAVAKAQGTQAETPQEVRRVGKSLSEAQSAIIGINGGESIKSAIDNYIADGAEDISSVSAVLDGLSESDREVAEDYFLARTRMQSYADKVQEIIDDAVSQEEERLAPYIYGGDSELEYDANGDIVRDEDGNAVERTTPRIFAEAVITPVNAHLKDEEPYSVMLTNYYPDSPFVTYVDANGVPQMVKRDDANIEVVEHDYDEYMAEYRAKIEADADARADIMLEHNEQTNRAMNIGETIETLNGQMTVLNNDGQGNVTLAPVQLNSKGETEVVRGSQPVTMSAREAMALQDEYYERPTDAQSVESVDNMSANQAQNEGISNGENEHNVSKPTREPIPTVQNGKKSRVAYEQVPVARTIEEVYGQFDDQAEVDEFIDLNIAEAETAVKNASKPKPKMSTDIEAYKQAKAKWQEEQAGLAEAQKRLDYWKEVKAESERMQGLDTLTDIPQETKKDDNAPRSAMEYVASMIGRLDPESYRRETGYGVKEQRKAGPIFLKKENGGMTVEGLAEWICEQPEAQEWGIQPGMDSEVRDMIIEVLSHGSPKAYIRDAHAQQAKADAYGEEQYLENMAAAQGFASADDMIAHDEVFLAEAIRRNYGLDENEYYANLAEEYEQEDNRRYGQGNERQDNGTSAERPGQVDSTAEVADVSGGSEVLSEEQSADTSRAESGNEQGELSGSTEGGNESIAENEAVRGESVEQEPSVAPEQQAVVERVGQWQQQLGVRINVITDASEVENETVREQLREKKEGDMVKGWFDPKTGEAYVYLPDNHSVEDVDDTIIHEVVVHKGLRGLLGRAKFNKLCDAVWRSMSAKDKVRFLSYVDGKVGNVRDQRAAADEYIAHLAEKMDKAELTKAEKGIWQTIVDFIMDALDKVGIKVTDKQIEALIKASYANMVSKASQTADTKDLLEYAQRDVERRAIEGRTMFSKRLKEVNDKFNKTLATYTEENADKIVFDLGLPSDILLSAGVANKRMKLYGSKVKRKIAKHKFSASDMQDLPMHVAYPIAVFDNYNEEYNRSILTELRTEQGNFLVTLSIGKGQDIDFNIISSVFGKGDDNVVNWLNKGYATYIDKTKALNYLHLVTPIVTASNNQELDSATKVIEEFENPKLSEEKPLFRKTKNSNNLIAVHNISESNLRKVLEMGGLIMPSIAVTDVNLGHSGYGEISLLFDKETINPSDRRNKVYGGDAWTPRFPKMEPKLNGDVVRSVRKKIEGLLDESLRGKYSLSAELHPSNIESTISNNGVEGYYGKEWMKIAYLLDNGKRFKIPMKMKDYGSMAETIIKLAKDWGLSLSEIRNGGYEFYEKNPEFVAAVLDAKNEARLASVSAEDRDKVRELLRNRPMRFSAFDTYISQAMDMERDLNNGGLKQVIDGMALYEAINKRVKTDNADYNKWVDDLFEGVVEKYGIRNNRDWYTPSGNSRPWEQLYDAPTPANILRYMLAQNDQGGNGGLWDSNIMGASAETYESIEEIREKGKKRLHKVSEDVYDEWATSVANRFSEICDEFMTASQKNDFGGIIDAKIAITNAVAKDKTAKGIYKAMKKQYANFTMEHAKRVEEIVKEIQDYATTYFEAKPQRVVELSEVRKAVVPSNVSSDIVEGLKKNGIEVATYRKGNEQSRNRVVKKESDGIRFRKANRNQVGFVSNAMVAVEGVKQEKATPEQWLKMIEKQGGLKAGEDKWLGLSDWLKSLSPNPSPNGEGNSKPRVVTKDEVLEFIGENMIQIEEVTYGEGMPKHAQEKLDELNEEFQALIWEGDEETGSVYTSDWVDYAWSAMVDRYGDDIDGAFEIEGNGTNAELVPMLDYNDEMVDQAKYFLEINDYTSKPINSTRLGYTTEGLENKREIALTVPTIESWNESDEIHFGDAGDGRAVAWVRFGETTVYEESKELKDAKNALEELKEKYDGQLVRNPNMTKEDENLAKELNKKIRELLLEGEAGDKRVLVIDEIQSKRHQEGREKGYKDAKLERIDSRLNALSRSSEAEIEEATRLSSERYSYIVNKLGPDAIAMDEELTALMQRNKELVEEKKNEENERLEIIKLNDELDKVRNVRDYDRIDAEIKSIENRIEQRENERKEILERIEEINSRLNKLINDYVREQRYGVSSAPFEKNWHELAMKRMLRLAAEEGFDKVAWTTGAQQAERYNIGSVVSQIESRKSSWGNSKDVTFYTGNGETVLFVSNKSGKIVGEEGPGLGVDVIDKPLSDVVGKSLAEKLMADGDVSLSGDGLSIGGEGMKGFYDNMLPSFVQKYTKKWGAKVGEVTLPNLEESAQKMWSVDVTDAMKESVEEQVMFRKKPADIEAEEAEIERKAKADGTWMKAPNGQPSKLNERQWVQVRTKAFKKWFGDWTKITFNEKGEVLHIPDNVSKVVDANGEPKVVYHGTTSDNEIKRWNEALKSYDTTHEPFYVFKRKVDGERNNGFFFNSNQQNAYDYGYNTYDTFLNIKNPLVIDAQGTSFAAIEYNKEIKDTYEWSEYAEGNGFDGVIFNNIRDGVDYNAMSVPTTDYVAFRPNQIKSATDNIGTFDEAEDDIRFRKSTDIERDYPNWLDGTTTESGKHSTQVEGTRKTYNKVGDWIEKNLGKGVTILDASSGMGYGTADLRERGFDIEDVEPYQSDERKKNNPATYSSYDDIKKKYDVVISNAVLNVIPDDWRADVLHDMARSLKEGGMMFINTRKAGEEKSIKDKIELDTPQEVLVKRNGKIASYQKFFTPAELKEWVEGELGEGYSVAVANEKNSGTKGLAAVVVTKEKLNDPLKYAEREVRDNKVMFSKRTTAKEGVDAYTKDFKTDGINITLLYSPEDYYRYAIDVLGANEEEADEFVELVKENKIGGLFLSGTNEIALFADNIDNAYSVLFHEHTHLAVEKLGDINRFAELASELSVIDEELADRIGQRYRSEDIEKEVIAYSLQYALEGGAMNELRAVLSDNSKALLDNLLNYIGYDTGKDYKKEVERQEKREGSNLVKRQQRTRNQVRRFSGLRGSLLEEGSTPQGLVEESAKKEGGLKGFDALAYAQQKVKEREDEVRMRKRKAMVRIKDKETEDQKRYNDETSGWFANLLEAWVDFLRPVRKLQESIEKTFGKLADYQNPYLLALTASSRNKIEEELLKVNLIEPMDKFLRGLIRKNNVSYDEIDRYLNAKHGLERNVKLAERDAKNLATDEDGNVDQTAYLNELQNNRKKDYSGLTDLFRTETEKENGTKVSVAELERRANEYIKSFEDRMCQENTETLWVHVKALNAFALQKSYSSNMLSKDELDELANMYEYYVPLRGFAEKTAGDIWNYLSDNTYGVVNPVKKTAEGRTSRADSIVATLYNMAESAIVQGNKNKTALALLNLAEQSPSSLLSVSRMWYVKNPDTKKWEVSVPDLENCDTQEKVTEAIQKHEEEMRAKEVLELAKRKKGKLEIQYKALPYHVAEHGVRVKRGGQEYIVYVNGNPKAAQALNGLLNEDVWHASKKNLDKFTKVTKWIFRWKAKTYTSLNPEFIITNFQRDLQSAFTIMAVRHGQKFAFDLTKHVFENVPLTSVIGKENKGRAKAVGIYTLYKKFFEGSLDMSNKRERYFHEFMMNGGETGYTQLDSVEDFKKKLENLDENIAKHGAKAAIKAVGDFIEFANRGIENAVRFAAFQTAREHGMSLLNSINEAKEASVNFNRKGSGALLNATARDSYMFINPAIQSTYQYAKLMKDYGWRGVGAFGVWSGLGVAIPLINIYVASMWAGDDDDETTMEDMYMALSPYKRRNFINIYIGNQTYFSVNLPVEQRVPYGLACIAMEMLTGQIDAEQGAWDMAGQVFNNILPRDIYNDNLGNARYSKGMSDFIEGVAKGLTPDLIADIAGPLVWNEDFLGRPITGVNKYNDYLPEWQRIGNNTPEWVRDMAKSVAKFDGNEYDKDWYDSQYLNPGGWYHIITQNVPLLPIISKGYKTYAAMAREDDVDEVVKNIPFGSRFLTTVNKDYAENRAMRYEFELLMSDIDDVDQQNKAINADKSISVMEAAELKEALKNTPEGIAHNVWTKRPKKGKSLRTRYDNIYDEYREARNNNDVKRKRELQAELDEIRKDAIERINEKVNETYGE